MGTDITQNTLSRNTRAITNVEISQNETMKTHLVPSDVLRQVWLVENDPQLVQERRRRSGLPAALTPPRTASAATAACSPTCRRCRCQCWCCRRPHSGCRPSTSNGQNKFPAPLGREQEHDCYMWMRGGERRSHSSLIRQCQPKDTTLSTENRLGWKREF